MVGLVRGFAIRRAINLCLYASRIKWRRVTDIDDGATRAPMQVPLTKLLQPFIMCVYLLIFCFVVLFSGLGYRTLCIIDDFLFYAS